MNPAFSIFAKVSVLSVVKLMSLFLWLKLFNGSCHTGVLEYKRASLRRQWQLLQA